jgi:hypothetical protein
MEREGLVREFLELRRRVCAEPSEIDRERTPGENADVVVALLVRYEIGGLIGGAKHAGLWMNTHLQSLGQHVLTADTAEGAILDLVAWVNVRVFVVGEGTNRSEVGPGERYGVGDDGDGHGLIL